MSKEIFPCRTKEISGTSYIVSIYDGDVLIMQTTYGDPKRAEQSISHWKEGYRCEINPIPWTKKVCIECGDEASEWK